MNFSFWILSALACICALFSISLAGGEHHHVIIHVPYKVKTIKHTHTIYKIIKEKEKPHEKYEEHDWAGSF